VNWIRKPIVNTVNNIFRANILHAIDWETLGQRRAKQLASNSVYKAQGKLGNIVAETLFPTNVSPCFPEWANTRKH
jgi:hypothetical protein